MREINGGSADSGDDAADSTRDRGSHQETWAKVQARIARWDELPSPEESGAKAWGDNPEFWDEGEQEWRTLDRTPSPGDHEVATASDVTSVPDGTGESAEGDLAPDTAGETIDELRQQIAGLQAGYARLEIQNAEFSRGMTELKSQSAELSNSMTELVSENTELGKDVTELRSENAGLRNGMAKLKSENAQQGRDIAELRSENAELRADSVELHRDMSAGEARLERLEQKEPVKPTAVDASLKVDLPENADERNRRYPGRELWKSNEAIGVAAMAGGGVVSTIPYFWRYLPPAYATISASVLAVGAAAVPFVRKVREVRDAAHRRKD